MKKKTVLKILLAIVGLLIVVSLCVKITNHQSDRVDETPKVKTYPEIKEIVELKTKTKITPEEIDKYAENHAGKNISRRYILGILLDEKYPVTSKERERTLTNIKKEMKEDFSTYLKENRLSEEELMEEVTYDEQVQRLGKDSLDLSEKNLKNYYNHWVPGMVIQQILVSDEKTINEVEKKLEQKVDFTTLVKEYTIDEAAKINDGKWSNFKAGDSFSKFDEAVLKLEKKDERTKPFRTIMGWHIVKIIETADKKPYADVKEQVLADYIKSLLTYDYLESQLDELLKSEITTMDQDIKKSLGL